ncbi:MAG: hypothetical protein KAI24_16415 [Planctomycetes bacterium]|nr:hypothetical protein [Planctomycetota bacterium]
MRTNSLGFRSAVPVDLPLQRNSARRILVIGDSFAEGVGVAFEDSFVGTLTEEFEAHGIEFLNAAVVSYSPTVYLAKVRHLLEVDGLRFDELVVCIDISDIEDEARFYTMDAEGRVARSTDSRLEEGVKGFIARQTLVMSALRSWFRTLRSRANEGVDVSRGLDRALWGSRQDLWEAYGRRGMRLATERMTELHALAERHGVEMTVAVYPWPDQILGRNTEHRQVQSWRAWCAERGVEFVNCFPAFLDDSDSESVIADCYIRGDVHWRREGHEKIAALLGARWR